MSSRILVTAFLAVVVGIVFVLVAAMIFIPDVIRNRLEPSCTQTCLRIQVDACIDAAGKKNAISASVTPNRDGVFFGLKAGSEQSGTQAPSVYREISNCIQSAFRANGIRNDYHSRSHLPLGLVEKQWQGGELALDITQDTDELNNLVFMPASGLRTVLISEWCQINKKCVSCTPNLGATSIEDAKTVSVSQEEGAEFTKIDIGTAPLSGNRKHPYQLVEPGDHLPEGIGRRVGFQCDK